MLVLRTNASPTPATMIPPGPGIAPTKGEMASSTTPSANMPHSTTGLSMNFRHWLRVNMRVDVVIHLRSRKVACGEAHGRPSVSVLTELVAQIGRSAFAEALSDRHQARQLAFAFVTDAASIHSSTG